MADVQVTSAELKDGTLTVTGSAFTKTTTQLMVDGADTPFTTDADTFDGTEITAQVGEANTVWAVKGGVESEHVAVAQPSSSEPASPTDPAQPPEQSTTEGMAGQPGDPQTSPTGSAESPSPTTSTEDSGAAPIPENGEIQQPGDTHEPIQVEGTDLSASEAHPQPEPDHTAYQQEQADQAKSDQENQQPYEPGGDVHEQGYKTADPNQTPGDLVEDDLKTTSDVDPAEMGAGVSSSEAHTPSAQDANQPDREPLKADEHLPGKDFRFRVENTKAEDLGKVIGPRDPYPKDNPPDPKEEFYRIHGHYQESSQGGE